MTLSKKCSRRCWNDLCFHVFMPLPSSNNLRDQGSSD